MGNGAGKPDAIAMAVRKELPADAICIDCEYSLVGLTVDRCPECGRDFDPALPGTYFSASRPKIGFEWRVPTPSRRMLILLAVGWILAADYLTGGLGFLDVPPLPLIAVLVYMWLVVGLAWIILFLGDRLVDSVETRSRRGSLRLEAWGARIIYSAVVWYCCVALFTGRSAVANWRTNMSAQMLERKAESLLTGSPIAYGDTVSVWISWPVGIAARAQVFQAANEVRFDLGNRHIGGRGYRYSRGMGVTRR